MIDSLENLVYAAREAERFPAFERALLDIVRAAGASLLVTSGSATVSVSEHPWGS